MQPLIRFEVKDQVTLIDGTCPCGSSFRCIEDSQGRLDTPRRATIHIAGPQAEIGDGLAALGLVDLQVRIDAVGRLPRPPSRKLKRFIPLAR